MKGGKRDGAGRKPGIPNKMSRDAVEKAKSTGELPHEFLLRISRGENIDGTIPKIDMRLHAAIAAAPYFAPKLANIEQEIKQENTMIVKEEPLTPQEWLEMYGPNDNMGTSGRTPNSVN